MRKLTEKDVTFTLRVEYETLPVRGNVMASEDSAFDKECEDEILKRLDSGDVWAWAWVEVTATYTLPDGEEFHGCASLGGCSCENEKDFCQPGGYYDDMKHEALDDLQRTIENEITRGKWLVKVFNG